MARGVLEGVFPSADRVIFELSMTLWGSEMLFYAYPEQDLAGEAVWVLSLYACRCDCKQVMVYRRLLERIFANPFCCLLACDLVCQEDLFYSS